MGTQEEEALPQAMADYSGRLLEVVLFFLRLGVTAFGGPAAHIAMMREELVRRRKWLSDQHFLDLLGEVNLIPGPNSTEMAIYLGYLRAGWPGLLAAGICFIGPAMLFVLTLAWAYVSFGSAPEAAWLLYGIKPVVIAIVAQALIGLARTALRSALPLLFALVLLVLYVLGVNELLLLLGGGVLFAVLQWPRLRRERMRTRAEGTDRACVLPWGGALATAASKAVEWAPAVVVVASQAVPYSPLVLFLTFLKIGAVLYGSGYVLLAFLRDDFVHGLRWLTDRQLLDAVSIGQLTPGPVFTTATFVGYIVGGGQGALLATLGIFLPSFVFVPLIHRLATALRRSPWTRPMLDGVNVAALALMAGVTLQLGQAALVDPLT
ncbi:MAG TPA: chromate efflux transporter [Ktedonobacterales bacterium]|nr:chromate efflux transporter [Ktedonobacterales bacterium]